MYALFHWWLKAGDGVMEEVITHWGALSTTQLYTTTVKYTTMSIAQIFTALHAAAL